MKSIDIALFRKMIACLPFADADAGIVETQDAMRDAASEIDRLRARVAELEAERDKLLPMKRDLESAIGVSRRTADGVLILSEDAIVYTYEVLDARSRFTGRIIAMKYSRWRFVRYEELWPNRGVWAAPDGQWWCYSTEQAAARAANGEVGG